MKYILVALVVGTSCVTSPNDGTRCAIEVRLDAYRDDAEFCVCQEGAVIPDACGGGIAASDTVLNTCITDSECEGVFDADRR